MDEPLFEPRALSVVAGDGARSELLLVADNEPGHLLYWLPAMGVPARHYLPLAQALAGQGVAVAIHEWRGIGSSDRRAGRRQDWGYRALLRDDLPAGLAAARRSWPQLPCLLGGHSLGGQLAALYASCQPASLAGLVLVASGLPWWRCFSRGWLIGAAYLLAPWLARACGHLPGRRIGFGGNEARGVIADWARSGRHGRYAAAGMPTDFEQQLAALALPILALRMEDDWLAPGASLAGLLGKMPLSPATVQVLDHVQLDTRADHFSWMRSPQPVAGSIAAWLRSTDSAFVGNGQPRP